jgi:hypothetical protein
MKEPTKELGCCNVRIWYDHTAQTEAAMAARRFDPVTSCTIASNMYCGCTALVPSRNEDKQANKLIDDCFAICCAKLQTPSSKS